MKNRGWKAVWLGAGLWAALGSCLVWASNYRYDAAPEAPGNYEAQISSKLTRGVTNVLFGWTEVVRTPVGMAQGPKKNFFKVVLVGIPYGALRAAARTAVGVYEIVTCFAPQNPIMSPIDGDVE